MQRMKGQRSRSPRSSSPLATARNPQPTPGSPAVPRKSVQSKSDEDEARPARSADVEQRDQRAKKKRKKSRVSLQEIDSKGLHDLLASSPSTSEMPARPVHHLAHLLSRRAYRVQGATCVLVVTALLIVLLGAVFAVRTLRARTSCDSDVCHYYSDLLGHALDNAVQPCVDFHAHVCARWEAANQVSVRKFVYQEFVEKVSKVASATHVPTEGQTAVQKAARFYKSCHNVYVGRRWELELLKNRLLDFGVFWPKATNESRLIDTLISMSAAWNWGAVIMLYTWKHGHFILSPTAGYGDTLQRRKVMLSPTSERSSYKQYFEKMVDSFRWPGDEVVTYDELIELEDSRVLPLIMKPYFASRRTTLVNASLDELEAATLGIIPKATWKQELQRYFSITVDSVFDIENVEFINAFFTLVKHLGEMKVMYYAGWALIQEVSLLSSVELISYFYQTESSAIYGHKELCFGLGRYYIGGPLFAKYMRESATPRLIEDASMLLRSVRHSLRQHLEAASLDWNKLVSLVSVLNNTESTVLSLISNFSDEHLDKLYRRVPNMTASIITNIELATQGRRLTEGDTEVPVLFQPWGFYHLDGGYFRLFPTAFEPPTYVANAPLSVKYGALGGEISDAFARLLHMALPGADAETRHRLESKVSCDIGGNSTDSSGAFDLGLRAMSLSALFEAFVRVKERTSSLPDEDETSATGTQLFFVLWCYIRCGSPNAKAQCNELLQVLSYFHQAFGCSRGSAMFPGRVCGI